MSKLFTTSIVVVVLSFVWNPVLRAQAAVDWSHRIGLRSGYLYAANRDELASPLKYSGGTLPAALSYEYFGASHRHHVSVSFRNGLLESSVARNGAHQLEEWAGGLKYTLLFESHKSDAGQLRVFVGGTWSNLVAAREYIYNTAFNGDELYGELYSSLSVTGLAEYRISDRSRYLLELSLPVVTFAVRPGYISPSPAPEEQDEFRAVLKGGKFSSWESYRAFDLGLSYEYVLGRLLDIEFQYRLQYSYYDKPQPTATALQNFGVGLLFKL